MSVRLIDRRCWHHPVREAVVRCPGCQRYYCRECVTEHQDRMVCAECVLRGRSASPAAMGLRMPALLAATAGGLLLCWLIFYYLGVMLVRIPSDFFGGPA